MGDIMKFMYTTLDVSVVRFFLWGIVMLPWAIVILLIRRVFK